jgi:phosphoserine phosphatase
MERTVTTSTPLPSWADDAAKDAILEFVARVTEPGGREFVRPSERIATFDNDGTLWCERPAQAQIYFTFDRVKELAMLDPTLRERRTFKAFLDHDLRAIGNLGKELAFEIGFATQAGLTEEEFRLVARRWLATARHPRLGRPFWRCTYQPQIELLAYLRQNGFKTFIVSGGGVDLIRAFAEEAYGIPPEQVIGSSVQTRVQAENGRLDLYKLPHIDSFDDREEKVRNIGRHIGRRPLLAFGNSDGDLAMLRYTIAGDGPRLALLLHHDDGEREFAYDREFKLSPLMAGLDEAETLGITLVSMRRDWKTVFNGDASVAA